MVENWMWIGMGIIFFVWLVGMFFMWLYLEKQRRSKHHERMMRLHEELRQQELGQLKRAFKPHNGQTPPRYN